MESKNQDDQYKFRESGSGGHSRGSSSHSWLHRIEEYISDGSPIDRVRQLSQDVLSRIHNSEGTDSSNAQQESFYKQIFKSQKTDAERVKELFEKVRHLEPINSLAMIENYSNRYKSSIGNNGRSKQVETRVQEHEKVLYKTNIYIADRVIEGVASYGKDDIKIRRDGTIAMHLSDIHWQQLREVLEDNNFDINIFKPEELRGIAIVHKKTVNKLKRYISNGETKVFHKDSEGYNALLTTKLGKSKVYFLERYFSTLEITRVAIEKGYVKNAIAKITYYLVEKTKTDVEST